MQIKLFVLNFRPSERRETIRSAPLKRHRRRRSTESPDVPACQFRTVIPWFPVDAEMVSHHDTDLASFELPSSFFPVRVAGDVHTVRRCSKPSKSVLNRNQIRNRFRNQGTRSDTMFGAVWDPSNLYENERFREMTDTISYDVWVLNQNYCLLNYLNRF